MGCSASSPEAVIGGISAVHNQSAAGDIGLDVAAAKTEEHAAPPAVVGNEGETASGNQMEDAKSDEVPKGEKTPDGETASNIKAQDSKCDDVGGVDAIIAKKGYVVFEINLDGELDTCLDSSKKPLPKRLKRLEPLPRAPKLTAEELNEKLERAEQKHLKALAMRKSGISRRFEKFAKQASRSTEDAPASAVARSDEAGESESSSTGTSENDTDVTAQAEMENNAEAPSRLFTAEENDQVADFKQNASAYEIVNLNNNNAISDRGGKTVTSPTPLNVTEGHVHGHHMLSAVREVDEENAE